MNWREKIICDWPNNLQKAQRCKSALQDLDKLLIELAGMGHPLHIEEGYVPPPPPGWPKAVFHILAGGRSVGCQADLDELGPDWYPTMEEARHAAGVTKQMQRGGIFTKSLPSMLTQTPLERAQIAAEEAAKRDALKKFINDTRLSNRASFQGNISLRLDEVQGTDPGPSPRDESESMKGRLG